MNEVCALRFLLSCSCMVYSLCLLLKEGKHVNVKLKTFSNPTNFQCRVTEHMGIDALVQSYRKGVLTHSVADPDSFMDVIPVDMVVNAMMVTMAAHRRSATTHHLQPHPTTTDPLSDQEEQFFIYHVGSSSRNPINYYHLTNWAYDYFTKNPHLGSNRKPIQVPRWTLLPTMESFSKYVTLHYKLPLEALRVVINDFSCNKCFEVMYNKLNRQYIFLTRLMGLFEPLVLYRGIFDTSNLMKLGTTMKEAGDLLNSGHTPLPIIQLGNSILETAKCCFDNDPKSIDWEDYFMNVHFLGSTKYVFNSDRPRVLLVTKSSL